MNNLSTTIYPNKGFSLVEMAIVLLIVGLLLGGLLPSLSSQMEQAKRNETRKQMVEISSALIGYALSQTPPRLPCPAKPTTPTGSANAGVPDCNINPRTGVLPWVTLGTSETDAWGRRFTYAVASSVTGDFATSFTLSSTGNLDVLAAAGGSAIASGMPAVIVSHGPNGSGAYLPQGNQLTVSADADEADNSNGGTTFVSHDYTSTFDDFVVWISPNILFNQMVTAGKLP